jgi:hypothetical protein
VVTNTVQQLVYDPRYHTFESWACLMGELYAAQQLEIPDSRTDWKLWAEGLVGIGVFNNQAVPLPANYKNWEDWAFALLGSMNPEPEQ